MSELKNYINISGEKIPCRYEKVDIYELEFFEDDSGDSTNDNDNNKVDFTGDEAKRAFGKYIEKKGKRWSEVFEVLGVKSMAEVTNYKEAYNQIKAWIEKED